MDLLIVAEDKASIIESVEGVGVIKTKDVFEWIKECNIVTVVWGDNRSEQDGLKVAKWAKSQIGKPYNHNFPFGKYQTDSYYCSSLCWNAWDQVGINLDKDLIWKP